MFVFHWIQQSDLRSRYNMFAYSKLLGEDVIISVRDLKILVWAPRMELGRSYTKKLLQNWFRLVNWQFKVFFCHKDRRPLVVLKDWHLSLWTNTRYLCHKPKGYLISELVWVQEGIRSTLTRVIAGISWFSNKETITCHKAAPKVWL